MHSTGFFVGIFPGPFVSLGGHCGYALMNSTLLFPMTGWVFSKKFCFGEDGTSFG